jgi:hypothetical protein
MLAGSASGISFAGIVYGTAGMRKKNKRRAQQYV